jgi:UDP-N-acetylmuramoylalanine--D-glutamate ligase
LKLAQVFEMKIGIIGLGLSGTAAGRLATALGNEAVYFADSQGSEAPSGIFSDCGLLVVSPGVPPESQLYTAAVASNIEIVSELEFGARNFSGDLLAITGTNGKTTTTELTTHLFQALGVNAIAAGNIGLPLCDICADILLGKFSERVLPVVEVSSFQLERCSRFNAYAAVLLNIASDHLNRYHGNITEYAEVKTRIFNLVPEARRILGMSLSSDNEFKSILPICKGNAIVSDNGKILLNGNVIIDQSETNLHGSHNLENLSAALELVRVYFDAAALFKPELRRAIINFMPGRHRLEKVAEIDGITFINDSKSTNPASTIAALRTLSAPDRHNVNLLLGGLDKAMDFTSLRNFSSYINKAYIYGQCRHKIFAVLQSCCPCEIYDSFEDATNAAAGDAAEDYIVLLSPACASMDMFKDYQARGDYFHKLVFMRQ